jgi:DNA-binding CsgD family transcriptional regulator
VLRPSATQRENHASQYSQLDPYRAAALDVSIDESARRRGDVRLGHEIVPDASYVHTEFYADFGRQSSRRYMIGALVSTSDVTPIGFHRDAASRPFAEEDKRTVSLLLPHLQRALQMHARLAPATPSLGAGALDALPIAVFVVDTRMQVLYSNAEGAALVSDPQSGLSTARQGPRLPATKPRLVARHPDDDALLCRLVGAAARGSAGGGMQIRPRQGGRPGDPAALSALVCPALRHLSSSALPHAGTSVMPGAATVLARNLLKPTSPPVKLLIDLFGLTRSEGEVAAALAGGVTAEDVARARRVSLDTVRSQIRTILGKTGASGLRDFERIIALSSTMHAPAAGRP